MKKIALVIHNENASTRETAAYLAEQGYTIYQVETLQDSELAAVTGDIQNKEGFALKGWHSVGPLSLPPYAC